MTDGTDKIESIDDRRYLAEVQQHRDLSLDLIAALPSYAVKTPRGQKDPGHFKWDPRNATEEKSKQNIFELQKSDDNLGIHLFGEVVDVDIDSDNPFLLYACDFFLPFTPHVWGRASRPRTHRLYQISSLGGQFEPGLYRFLQSLEKIEPAKLELRGGRKENARYSLMPGSLHPSNEHYMWDDLQGASTSPVIVPEESLVKAVRLACTAAVIAPHWIEGARNHLCMALSGFLYKAVVFSEELGVDSLFNFTKDDAEHLIRGICSITDDDEADLNARLKTLEKTWEKAGTGTPLRGATSIAEVTGDEEIVRHLYTLLTDARGLVEFEEFAKNFALWMGEGKVISLDLLKKQGTSPIMGTQAFHDSFGHLKMERPGGEGQVPMTRLFMSSKHILRVNGFKFRPGEDDIIDDEGNWLNRWQGFAIPPAKEPVDDAEIQIFLDYLRHIVANDDPLSFEWILAWIADIFKNPQQKCGTALVLVGAPGAGKSFLGHKIIQGIIGGVHSATVNSISSLVGTFNSDSAFKLFVQCDEALNSRQREVANRMKAMVTDRVRRVEPKNVNAFYVEDETRYLLTSNEEDDSVAIVDGEADRRYSVYEVSRKYAFINREISEADKDEYWKEIHKWAENEENLAKLHRYFKDHEYDPGLIRKPLATEARTRTQQSSMRGFDDWLFSIVIMSNPFDDIDKAQLNWSWRGEGKDIEPSLEEWPSFISISALKRSYDIYRRKKGAVGTPEYNEQQLIHQLRDRRLIRQKPKTTRRQVVETEYVDGDIVEKSRRIRLYEFPSKRTVEHFLRIRYGYTPIDTENVPEEMVVPKTDKKDVGF